MSPFLGEVIGTMVLILLGNGVVANVVLNKTKGNSSGWIVITMGWGLAVFVGAYIALTFGSDAHLNPAVTIGLAVKNMMDGVTVDWGNVVIYIIAQFIGAILGAVLVWLQYLPHWGETEDGGAKLACFSTGPAIRNTTANFVSETIGTFMLMLGILAIPAAVSSALPGPWVVGFLVVGIGISLGGSTGYAINPARDLGPRIAHMFLPLPKKGDSDLGYAWIPVVGPVVGAIIAAVLYTAIL